MRVLQCHVVSALVRLTRSTPTSECLALPSLEERIGEALARVEDLF